MPNRQLQTELADGAVKVLNGHILLVDDDPHFLRVLARLLKAEDFQVRCASGAAEALRMLGSCHIDVVISDMRMPECDGVHLMQQIHAAENDVPVIILTAYDEVDNYLEALNAGANEYLRKPVDTKKLLDVVRACLRRRDVRNSLPPADKQAA